MTTNITDSAGGTSFSAKTGKHSYSITLTDCAMVPYSTYTNSTTAFREIIHFLKSKHRAAVNPLYCFVYNQAHGAYLYLSYDTSGNAQNFMMGYPQDIKWEMGIMNMISSLKFKECTT